MEATRQRSRAPRRTALIVAALIVAGVVAFAITRLNLGRIGHALISASPGWIALALALMMVSMLFRAVSWHQTLRAALPDVPVPRRAVVRATMIGVMGSAVFPGRLGEPSRMLVLSRRLPQSTRHVLPIVAGTVFSQTLINLLALGILAAITFSSVSLLNGHPLGLALALGIPLAICVLVLSGPRLLRLAARSHSLRLRAGALALARLLRLARQGLLVFARPRHGIPAIAAQLLAWALQWAACYVAIIALHLQSQAGPAAAAAVLLAINVSAILPATPSNVGVFQAACLVVLAAYGVAAGPALAYGIILQAIEVVTALALGIPALLGEGMSWRDIRRAGGGQNGPAITG